MRIILNQIQTPDGTMLRSYSVHDCNEYLDKNGEIYSVDGGTRYLKRSINTIPYIESSIMGDAPFDVIRKHLHWGSKKNGLEWIALADMTTEHITSILITQSRLDEIYRYYFLIELDFRRNLENKDLLINK